MELGRVLPCRASPTALLWHWRGVQGCSQAAPSVCSKGRFVSQGVSIAAGQGGAEQAQDPASRWSCPGLQLSMRLIAKLCVGLSEQLLQGKAEVSSFSWELKIDQCTIEMVPAVVAEHMGGSFPWR